MRVERSIDIDAPTETVWRILVDVEQWPEWTRSAKRIVREEQGAFGMGSRAKLWLRGAPAATVWTVTSCEDGRSFTWESRVAGAHSIAWHAVEPRNGAPWLSLRFEMRGAVAAVLSPVFAAVGRRNLGWESEGLKRRAEERPA